VTKSKTTLSKRRVSDAVCSVTQCDKSVDLEMIILNEYLE